MKKLPLNLPIPENHPLFDGAKIFLIEYGIPQNYPDTCDHCYVPDGIELDTDTVFIEDIWCIPVRCENCGVGRLIAHDCSLKKGKIT